MPEYSEFLDSLDWDSMWRAALRTSSWHFKGGKDRWAERAKLHNDRLKLGCYDDYIEKVMSKIDIDEKQTVLDIGCGPGTLAIPLAHKAKHVTCLDVSKDMLKYAQENAAIAGVSNISFIEHDWDSIEIGKQLEAHDVVIASRWVGNELKKALMKMDQASKKRSYMIWGIGSDEIDRKVCNLLGREYSPHPGYIYIYNQLYQVGIQAQMEVIKCKHIFSYRDIQSAVDDWRWGIPHLTIQEKAKLVKYLLANRDNDTGFINLNSDSEAIWAIISWRKNNSDGY